MVCGEFDQFLVRVVVIWVEGDLLQVSPSYPSSGRRVHTWFTVGVTVATFIISWR